MKKAKIRHILESEIFKLKARKKPLTPNEFEQYCNCLKRLLIIEQKTAMKQKEIYSCTYGCMGDFVNEFTKYTTPLASRCGKEIRFNTVCHSRTYILFSPRLAEIAIGSMLSEFLRIDDAISASVFDTKSGVAVCVTGKELRKSEFVLRCIKHIARLHGGRCIVSLCTVQSKIIIIFPFLPSFQPLKLVPCSTELCRLCRI